MAATEAVSKKRKYVPAIGPKLKKLFYVVLAILSLLGANSLYLATITFLEWQRGESYQNQFYMAMFLGHIVVGLIFLVPFLLFGLIHLFTSRKRKNKRAIRVGYALFAISIVVLVTGLLLVRVGDVFDLKQPTTRSIVYWLHVLSPVVAIWLYWLHRLVGQKIKWKIGVKKGLSTLSLRWRGQRTALLSQPACSIMMSIVCHVTKMRTRVGVTALTILALSITPLTWSACGRLAMRR